jgi:hypothetical protein
MRVKMRSRISFLACSLVLTSLVGVPGAAAQTVTPAAAPDPAQIVLAQAGLDGWAQSQAVRTETWGPTVASSAPNAASQMYAYETDFTRQLSDGTHESLMTRATEGPADLRSARFQAVQHDALGQTPIQVPGGAVGFWEDAGDTRTAAAAAQAGNILVELRVSGVTTGQPVGDDQVASWLSTMLAQATNSPDAPPFDWSQALPGHTVPWPLVLDQASVGGDWDLGTGLQLSASSVGGNVQSVSAAREFSRSGAYKRTLQSIATVYNSSADAIALGMTAPGKPIDAPALGDQAAAFKATESGDGDAPEITYTIAVRHGPVVITTQETGVAYSLDSPDETVALATTADTRASSLLAQ